MIRITKKTISPFDRLKIKNYFLNLELTKLQLERSLKFPPKFQFASWFPEIHPKVWILAVGRLLLEMGTGFTLFYAPIFFVNKVGLSTTAVGLALGSASISGVAGRIFGGIGVDSPSWGRRRTLLFSAAISAIGSLVLSASHNFATLVIGNLIAGFGLGLYWPANEAVVADLTPSENRREAYAITRLADNLGLGMGIVLGGILVTTSGSYRSLFIIDAISFIVFFGVVYLAIAETYTPDMRQSQKTQHIASWMAALSDRPFLVYVVVNIIFTTYVSQLHSTIPIYLKNFVSVGNSGQGFSETTISALFALHLAIAILSQIPVARILKRFSHTVAFTFSCLLWAIGFSFIWACGIATTDNLFWAALALGVFAVAITGFTPSASSLVTDLAPQSQRGVYFAINSLCWAVGYFIGPSLGGWALDQPQILRDRLWLGFSFSVVITLAILQYLNRILPTHTKVGNQE